MKIFKIIVNKKIIFQKFTYYEFSAKIKTVIKNIEKDEKIEAEQKEESKDFLVEIKPLMIDLEHHASKNMKYWFAGHILPSIIFLPYFMNFAWAYQIFWVSTSIGIVTHNYQFYSNLKEKKILDRHIMFR